MKYLTTSLIAPPRPELDIKFTLHRPITLMDVTSEGTLTVCNARSWTSEDGQSMSFGQYHAKTVE